MNFRVELQPIVDGKGNIWGYEVLFRGSFPNHIFFQVANPKLEIEIFKRELEIVKDFDTILTFNLSPITLKEFGKEVKKILRKYENIFIELTEIPHRDDIKVIKDLGNRIFLDDFLKGSSSIERLLKLKPYGIKIEKNFMDLINIDKIKGMVKEIIVEKIESRKDFEELKGKDLLFQGFLFKEKFITLAC
ncbi:MAG TPA: EAL domain-containing protein [Aquifex aeolicus]|nr:EAL domain-containing protein [Aquifex aeolicus]